MLNKTPATTARKIDSAILKGWLSDGQEIALLDVREHGQYGESHLFFAVNAPFSSLELEIVRLVPRRDVRVVVYDDGDGVSEKAAKVLAGAGYSNVWCLEGGAPAWKAAGFGLFAGVNLPSKTFGELAEHAFETPRIGARDLAARLERKDDLIVLDGRPFTEFQKMNIPGSICVPNGELALRVDDVVASPDTTIVVNCAGRTRSIVGAQTLIDLGLPNPVFALENGTQGWYLEDLALEHGALRRHPTATDPAMLDARRQRAMGRAERAGVRFIDAETARAWLADGSRTTFLCDVRTPEEFQRGSLPGAQLTPGGQLIQATDLYVGVQGSRLVVFDGELVRAPVVASWLIQMGWDVAVLREGVDADLAHEVAPVALPPRSAELDLDALRQAVEQGASIFDIRPGRSFRAGHIAGSTWTIRPRFERLKIERGQHVVLIAEDPRIAAIAAASLRERDIEIVGTHIGAPHYWRTAGLNVIETPDEPSNAECIDFLFFVHDRHDGNKQAARQYLAWETDLIHQIDAQERARFKFQSTTTNTMGER